MSMSNDEMKALVKQVKDRLRITKVVATRSVKGKHGDVFVGYSSAWDSVQEDGGQGLVHTGGEADEAAQGMTLKEAKMAAYILGMQADTTAFEQAMAGSIITPEQCERACKAIKHNYGQLMAKLLQE